MIRHADCLDAMADMDAASVDAIVTDPPYGLAFMGKKWDRGVPGPEFWEAALRVAKPASYLLAFGGTRTEHRLACAIEDAGWTIQDKLMWLHGQGFPKGKGQLKPAWEPIIMARKAGKGARLQVDACRIPVDAGGVDDPRLGGKGTWRTDKMAANVYEGGYAGKRVGSSEMGRWPANVCLDEEAAAMLDEQAGPTSVTGNRTARSKAALVADTSWLTNNHESTEYTDSGGPSRFFYCAKASRAEREAGLEGMPLRLGGVHDDDAFREPGERKANHTAPGMVRNPHPTVKPIALMRWLCRLVTPPGGLILDPFAGSGTTGCAAALEGFRFIGCEKEAEYAAIAEARIAHWGAQPVQAEAFR